MLGTCLLTLAGCSTLAPTPAAPQLAGLPAAWSTDATATATATTADPRTLLAWWRRFDDPLLTQLVQQALQANTGVRGAQAALRRARALQDVAAAGLGPMLSGSADAQSLRS